MSSPNPLMSALGEAVCAFLATHREPLLALVNTGGPLDDYQVEIHTLAGLARMLPDEANLVRLRVSPKEGSPGSNVITSVLAVGGVWFELAGPIDCEEMWSRLVKTASEGLDGASFDREAEPYLTRNPHPLIQPYLEQHFPATLAQVQAMALDEATCPREAPLRAPRL